MAFMPAERSRVLVGSLNLSIYATEMEASTEQAMLDVTGFCDVNNADSKSMVFIPGQDSSTFSLSGNLDTDASTGGQFSVLSSWRSTAGLPLTYAPSGLVTGSECFMAAANQTSYETASAHDAAVTFSLEAQTDGPADVGVVVENLTAVTVDGNGTARDGTAATSNGGVAHLHVSAFSGLTNNIVTIEHSVDGSTSWATLVTFATYTGVTSERVVVAPATTVRRYLRVVDNVTGTGSTTRAVTFSRR